MILMLEEKFRRSISCINFSKQIRTQVTAISTSVAELSRIGSHLGQKLSVPTIHYFQQAKRVLRSLKGTDNHGITFGFADASFAREQEQQGPFSVWDHHSKSPYELYQQTAREGSRG